MARRTRQGPTAFTSAAPLANFTITTEERVRALSIGVPAFAERKRRIEDQEEAWVEALLAVHDRAAARGARGDELLAALRAKAATFDFARTNALVAAHNRYYPIEANLPIDPRTGTYLLYGKPWHPEPTFDAERVVRAMLEALEERERARAEPSARREA